MTMIFKSREDDLEKIESLVSSQSKEFQKLWTKYLDDLKSDASLKIIRDFLEAGRDDLAVAYLEEKSNYFLPIFLTAYMAGALAEIALLTASAIKNQSTYNRIPKTSFSFDNTDYYVNQQIRGLQNGFIENLKDSQRRLFDAVVREARGQGMNVRATARYLIDKLGMTEGQFSAVLNYEKLLRANSREAANRILLDSEKAKIDTAVKNKRPLTDKQIDKMVAAYKRRFIKRRAEEIARNTTKTIIEEGRAQAATQLLNQAGLTEGDMIKEWRSRRDQKVRNTHKQHIGLDGQKVKENEYFVSPSGARLRHPHDSSAPLSETSGCRCFLLRYIKPQDR